MSIFTFIRWMVGAVLFLIGMQLLLGLPDGIPAWQNPTWRTVVYVAMVLVGAVLIPPRRKFGKWWDDT